MFRIMIASPFAKKYLSSQTFACVCVLFKRLQLFNAHVFLLQPMEQSKLLQHQMYCNALLKQLFLAVFCFMQHVNQQACVLRQFVWLMFALVRILHLGFDFYKAAK